MPPNINKHYVKTTSTNTVNKYTTSCSRRFPNHLKSGGKYMYQKT